MSTVDEVIIQENESLSLLSDELEYAFGIETSPPDHKRRRGFAFIPWRPIGDTSPEAAVEFPPHDELPENVKEILKKRGDAPIRLYADGIFDITHYGHFRALEQAKKAFPNVHLLVGVCNDEITHRLKGQTVFHEKERYESMRHCKWVDEVIPNAPWVITNEFLLEHDIDLVCHDALPYVDTSGQSSSGDVYQHLKEIGKFQETQRTEGVSTTELIMRIIKRYDDFVRRNMARGITAKEMGLNPIKEASLRLQMQFEKGMQGLEKGAANAAKGIHALSERAEGMQQDFLKLFGREGSFRKPFVNVFGAIKKTIRDGMKSPRLEDHEQNSTTSSDSDELSPGRKRSRTHL